VVTQEQRTVQVVRAGARVGMRWEKERRMRTPVTSLRTADIRASEAFRAYAGHIDQTDVGQTEHGIRWKARYALSQVEQGYSRTGWSVRLFEVGGSGGGADLIRFLAYCELTRQKIDAGGGRANSWILLVESGEAWASSSVVEQGTFNPRVVGSIPTWLTLSSVWSTRHQPWSYLLNSRRRDLPGS
jgi:hypothetical protein